MQNQLEKSILEFIFERQRIYQRRSIGKPWPWTNDQILRRTKINNIFRRLDAFSQYELDQIYGLDPVSQVKFILIARYLLSEQLVKFICETKKYQIKPNDLRMFKDQVGGGFNYINEVIQFYRPPGIDTEEMICQYVVSILLKAQNFIIELNACPSAISCLTLIRKTFPNLGQFRTYEVYTSLTYLPWFKFTENDVLVIGPGSVKVATAMNLKTLHDFQTKASEIDKILKKKKLNFGLTYTVRTLEDTLCEFRKYTNSKDREISGDIVNLPVKVYKPNWYPVLEYEDNYNGPSYKMGKFAKYNGSLNDRVKLCSMSVLPYRVRKLLGQLKHGKIYTRSDISQQSCELFGQSGNSLLVYIPCLVQLKFLEPLED